MPKICFVPIWHPVDEYVTSRLRAKYVAELLAGQDRLDVGLDYQADADIAVMVQLCSDRNYRQICDNRRQLVVYDICDRFFETHNVFRTDEGAINAGERCLELIERADVLIVPTRQLKGEVSQRFPDKPCYYVPELVDYGATPQPVSRAGSRRLLWFGHPTRGNFESARWIIDHLRARYGYQPVLVTNPWTVTREYPAYAGFCQPWSPATMRRELARAELCVVSHAADEPSKSPNRFVTAVMHGVPTLVSGSPACQEILQAAGFAEFAIASPQDVDRALAMLSNPQRRAAYVDDLQKEMWRRHGPAAVRDEYLQLLRNIWPATAPASHVLNLAFVTSLSDSGPAEPHLPELAGGLHSPKFPVHIYALEDGPQRSRYEKHGIGVDCQAVTDADDSAAQAQAHADFARFLNARNIDLVICDGVTTARYCQWARNEGRRTVALLGAAGPNEPSGARAGAPVESVDALGQADALVFTSQASRIAWKGRLAPGGARTIPMRPSPQPFVEAAFANRREARLLLGLPADIVIGLFIEDPADEHSAALQRMVEAASAYPLAGHLLRVKRSQAGLVADRLYGPGLPGEGRVIEPSRASEPLEGLFLRAADFCVVPARPPTAHRDCAVAFYFGLPVLYLASAAGDLPIRHGKEGLVAPDGANAVRFFFQLSTDARLRAEMGDRTARRFWEGPTYREMLRSFQSMIAELCSLSLAQP